jgi:hypothetical protein
MTCGCTDHITKADTQSLVPSSELGRHSDDRTEIDQEENATIDESDCGGVDPGAGGPLPSPVPADAENGALDHVDVIERRYRQEGWTTRDLYAAFLQASLLSYRSSGDAKDKYGNRYVNSAPSDYQHNCPWNNWTPPSKSVELFQAAAESSANKTDLVLQRVRVHMCREAAPASDTVVAFAFIETNHKGTTCLRLRRGAEILASWPVATLRVAIVGRGLVVLSTSGATEALPSQWLKFETEARLTKFCDMLKRQ